MLKPASFDPNYDNAMQRFIQDPDQFGPSQLVIAEANIGGDVNASAHRVVRDAHHAQTAKTEAAIDAKAPQIRAEMKEVQKEMAKKASSKKRKPVHR